MKDECAKAQELNMLIPDTPAGLTPFMQCLTYMRESDIKKHHVSLPVPAKAGLGLGERQYMVLDKAGG